MSFARIIGRNAFPFKAICSLSKNSKSTNFILGYRQSFSTILEKKELSEEAKFIRNQEAKRKEEIRAKMEQILALEDGNEQKVELIGILEGKNLLVKR